MALQLTPRCRCWEMGVQWEVTAKQTNALRAAVCGLHSGADGGGWEWTWRLLSAVLTSECYRRWESHVLPGSWSETMRRRSSCTVTLFPKPPFFLPSCGRFTLKANRIRLSTIHLVWCRKQFSVKLSPSEIDIMPSVSRCLQISSS